MSEKLYMLMLGCKPPGRFTEQHDIFFGIASSLKELVPYIKASWPEADGNIHIDAWREVTEVDGFHIAVKAREKHFSTSTNQLFFLNLGGYRPAEFDEYHYKMLTVAENSSAAIQTAKQTTFFKHTGFKGASAHIDDKYGIDVDDIYNVADILHPFFKERWELIVSEEGKVEKQDEIHLGFLQLWKIPD